MNNLMTVEEVSVLLNVPKSRVYDLSYKGLIPGKVKIGKRTLRFDREAIGQWLNDLKKQASCNPYVQV